MQQEKELKKPQAAAKVVVGEEKSEATRLVDGQRVRTVTRTTLYSDGSKSVYDLKEDEQGKQERNYLLDARGNTLPFAPAQQQLSAQAPPAESQPTDRSSAQQSAKPTEDVIIQDETAQQ